MAEGEGSSLTSALVTEETTHSADLQTGLTLQTSPPASQQPTQQELSPTPAPATNQETVNPSICLDQDQATSAAEKRKLDEEPEDDQNKKLKVDQQDVSEPVGDGAAPPATQCEVSSSSPEKMNDQKEPESPGKEVCQEPTKPGSLPEKSRVEEEEKIQPVDEDSSAVSVDKTKDESKDNAEEEEAPKENEDEMDETATKLLAGGISISLIKKKRDEKKQSDDEDKVKESNGEERKSAEPENPLEVGPNISVTMINKASLENQQSKFTLSLKSQSELIDPKKNDNKSIANILSNGVVDTLSVSKVNKPPAVSSPSVSTKPSLNPKTSQSIMSSTGQRSMPGAPPTHSMPGLLARPNGSLRPNLPLASAGAVSDQLNLVASGIAEYMRHGIEEILRELSSQGSPEATIKGLQLELEKMQWRHQQEMSEVKQSIDLMLKDMKSNMAKESQRSIEEFKKQAEMERQKAILETKKKQWCSHCGKEAIFYCCWNTSYCDYPCQQAHWPSHMATCSQTNQEDDAQDAPEQKPAPVSSALMNSLNRQPNTMAISSMSLANSGVGMPPSSMGFVMPGMGMGMRPGMGMRSPMGVSIRPGMPGQLTISRPYFM